MSETSSLIDRTGRWMKTLALVVASLGGIVLVLLAILTGVNVIGRMFMWAGLRPVSGDVELIEAGIAFAVTAFLPWCQLQRGHASVTIIADSFGKMANAVIDLISDFLLTGIAVVLVWRHALGMLDKMKYGETTFILQFPLWWSYAACLVGMVTWIIVGLWTIAADIEAVGKGEPRVSDTGLVH